MSLQDKLDEQRKQFESSAPPEALTIMHRATDDLLHSGIMEHILKMASLSMALPSSMSPKALW